MASAGGILGTGAIAHKFATATKSAVGNADLVAVARALPTQRVSSPRNSLCLHRHARYGSLTDDEDVDVVCVATPNPFHRESCLLCLRAGAVESEIMPLDETLGIMRILDRIRSLWGLTYPNE